MTRKIIRGTWHIQVRTIQLAACMANLAHKSLTNGPRSSAKFLWPLLETLKTVFVSMIQTQFAVIYLSKYSLAIAFNAFICFISTMKICLLSSLTIRYVFQLEFAPTSHHHPYFLCFSLPLPLNVNEQPCPMAGLFWPLGCLQGPDNWLAEQCQNAETNYLKF